MHQQALGYLAQFGQAATLAGYSTGIDIGGRETNGNARWLFPHIDWTVVDAVDGPGVDVVANGATWRPDEPVDLVLFVEVAEHSPRWPEILRNIHSMLKPDGILLFTAAGTGREPHGLFHDDPDEPGYYQNLSYEDLHLALDAAGYSEFEIDVFGDDIRAWAKP